MTILGRDSCGHLHYYLQHTGSTPRNAALTLGRWRGMTSPRLPCTWGSVAAILSYCIEIFPGHHDILPGGGPGAGEDSCPGGQGGQVSFNQRGWVTDSMWN